MDIQKFMKVGQLAAIEFFDEHGQEIVRYPTKVQDITPEWIYLSSPAAGAFIFRLPEGTFVDVWFSNFSATYHFKAQVWQNEQGKIPMLVVTHPEKLEKVQQREFVRVHYGLDVHLSWTKIDDNGEKKKYAVTCRSRDISAGGIMLILKKQYKLLRNDVVHLEFTVHGKKYDVQGIVIKNELERGSEASNYALSVKFTTLTENQKNQLVKSVFQRQIELKKKGLL